MSSGKYLFGRDPWTYTRCQEQIDGIPVVVGGFTSGGLCVYNYNGYDFDHYGAAASLKFC